VEQEEGSGRPRAPWLRAWLTVALAAWAMLGVLLVNRANAQGLIRDISFSPYHAVGYAALAVLAGYVAWACFRALRHGRWRTAFPPLYGGLGLGFLALVAWVVLDPIWRDTLGINENIEGGLGPTRLLIPLGLALLATGPVREAVALRQRHGLQPAERTIRWAGVAGAGLVAASATLVAFNPIQNPVADWSFHPAIDNSEIWAMDADGSNQTRLLAATGGGIDYSLPVFSADGSRIAFTTWTNDDGGPQNLLLTGQTASIWTMAADGSSPQALIALDDADAWIPAWSPDGAWLAYTVTPHDTAPAAPVAPQPNQGPGQVGPPSGAPAGSSIWIARADGTGARRLSSEGIDASGPAWSPDGTRLAFVAGSTNAEPDIHIATITESGVTDERVIAGEPGVDWGAAWSPDGSQLAFVSDRSADDEIWMVDIAGTADSRRLTDSPGGDWVPAFSPDGTRLAFVSERAGQPEVWDMAVDGSDLRNLTNQPWHLDGTWAIGYSPDGSRIAYASASFQDPVNSGWVREDLAAAQAVIFGLVLAAVALVLVAMGAPFGSFTVVLTIVVAAGAIQQDGWRYLVAGIAAGLLVDALVAVTRRRWRARVAAAALPALANLALAATIAVAGTLTWSWTLVLGVAVLSALAGWALAEAVERLLQHAPPPAAHHPRSEAIGS
jgi:Tol biopolymer transport system component